MNKIRKQTWKYFWQQKLKEVSLTLLGLIIFYGFMNLTSIIHKIKLDSFENVGICFCITLFGLMVIILIVAVIYSWISSNWERAEERAREKLR